MEEEKKEVLNLLQSLEFKNWVEEITVFRIAKNPITSVTVRKKGNEMYNSNIHNDHEEIWKNYSLSIALAENESEDLALAYGNRSLLLMHIGKYAASMKDIDRALNITKNKALMIKLLLRKVKCLHAVGSKECQSVYQEAKRQWNEIPEASLKKSFQNAINMAKLLLTKPLKQKSAAKDRQSEMLDELAHQHKVNDFSSVKVHYSNKYGRHLIATKDFRPGDVVYVEEPYVQVANVPRSHAFCSHCFATTWANIPCDHCAFTLFCSEECKNDAWIKYHDVECSLYGFAKEDGNDKDKQVAVRLLIMALKEFSSIDKLKSELMTFDKCSDKKKGFVADEKIKTDGFKTLYTLSTSVTNENLKLHRKYTKMVLTALAKNTSYFGEYFDAEDYNSYKNNENVLFLGSLFLRLTNISQINSRQMWNHSFNCKRHLNAILCEKNQCCSPGAYISLVSSLINHSCNPNVKRCYTSNGTIVLYAVQPIKKASQIFDCYIQPYYLDDWNVRQNLLSFFYNFQCDCPACKQQWPCQMGISGCTTIDKELSEEFKNVLLEISTNPIDNESNFDAKVIARLGNGIKKGLKYSSRPTMVTRQLIYSLQICFNQIYGINLCVPKECLNV